MLTTTYTNVRTNLAQFLDKVTQDREPVLIQRRGHEDVVMISADELNSLLEVAHLLRSPKNAERLLRALERARCGAGTPQSVDAFKSELGLADEQKGCRFPPRVSGRFAILGENELQDCFTRFQTH